jgi:hypothetical protein
MRLQRTAVGTLPASGTRPPPEPPLHLLDSENRGLLEASQHLMRLLKIPVWTHEEVSAVDELIRGLRIMLPAHFLKAEHILFPELLGQGILTPDAAAHLRRRHLRVEDEFAHLQAIALAIGVGSSTRSLRRKVLRAVRTFSADLEDLLGEERSAALDTAAVRLPEATLERVRAALDAAQMRDVLKRLTSG